MNYEQMKQKAVEDQGNVELRSEKIRNIIGQMPSFLIRWGNTVLLVIFLLLLAAFFIISPFFMG